MDNGKGLNSLRQLFFEFFKDKDHLVLDSHSLVPENDSSLLFINSGMAPMKDWFLGNCVPKSKRVCSCQKCIRTPDIDRVGKTSRHGTFFEMLGNFSFGDYFKKEAIEFAFEFVRDVLKLPLERIYVTVYEEDDEAYELWSKTKGLDLSHISRLGKDDNFWEIGLGPCGPCSEIYYDRGEEFGCGRASCKPGCECDRFVEFWNLVFSQYENKGNGEYVLMKNPNIDTGMGLERLACIVQGVDNIFEVDSIKKILLKVCELAKVRYQDDYEVDVLVRIITDHLRSCVFLICDGVVPSNEGRGYVLRRLIRRAHLSGRKLKISGYFLKEVARIVVEQNCEAYCSLKEKREYIDKILDMEQRNFEKILEEGGKNLNELVEELKLKGSNKIEAADAFKLCDTYGYPYELLKDFALEKGFSLDEAGFLKLMEDQKQRARAAAVSSKKGWQGGFNFSNIESTEFVGYCETSSCAKLLAIFKEDEEKEVALAGEEVNLIFNKTPFYAEGGGQVSDFGEVCSNFGMGQVLKCEKTKTGHHVHRVKICSGRFELGQEVVLKIDEEGRKATSRNHSAAHILQKVLINMFGDGVHQAGQFVNSEKLRFDFSCFEAPTEDDLAKIEQEVNKVILSGVLVKTENLAKDEAKKLGAIALFSEKYGEMVRVVEIGDFSLEFCGGTHVKNSAEIGLFKIISESSVGLGIRRIEAKTGLNVLKLTNSLERTLKSTCEIFRMDDVFGVEKKAANLVLELKKAEDRFKSLSLELCKAEFFKEFEKCEKTENGLEVLAVKVKTLDGKLLTKFGDFVRDSSLNVLALILSEFEGKFKFMVACGNDALKKGMDARDIVKKLNLVVGGKGGGKNFCAVAGISSFEKEDELKRCFFKLANET